MAELKRVAGFGTILAISIGSIMGTGIFMGPAIGAGISGNASIVSWIILSIISLYVAACFGELVAMFPKAGGVYEFGKQTYGRFFSFIIGWLAWIMGNITTVVIIVAGVEYLLPGNQFTMLKVVIGCVFLIMLNVVAFLGMQGSSLMVILFTIINLIVLLGIIVPGLFFVNPSNYSPFFTGGLSPVIVTIFFIAEGFFGWEAATYLAEETKDPEKIIPKALIIATLIVAVLAILMTIVMLGVIPFRELANNPAPLTLFTFTVFSRIGGLNPNIVMDIISIGVYLTLLGSAADNVIAMPRLILALARDKLFLKQFTVIHPKYFTPHLAIFFQCIACMLILFIGFGKYKTLLSLLVPIGLIMYSIIILAVPILRFRKPELERKFKAPFGKIGPFVVVLFFISLIALWAVYEKNSATILGIGGSLILIGIPLYFLVELYNDPDMITEVNDLLAYGTLVTESVNFPRAVRQEITTLIGDVRDNHVLEFGCNVGTLTMWLAEAVGPHGRVYATSFSKNHLKITEKRINRQKWLSGRMLGDVKFLHDIEHMSRVHPEVGKIDVAVSVGMMGYVQEVEKVLREVNALMPEGGKICFMDYGDYFHLIPNVDWLSNNEKIEKIFRECGFSVQVKRRKGLFWNYIFIYGIKFSKDVPYI
ncbi:MAG: amino acid permease [Candidatus Woesearchaeota archaeon]